jgi:hypothetical protein
LVFADLPIPFFVCNNFTIDADTTFTADINDGSSGLLTTVGIGLWFEFVPYADRNITPQRDTLSVSIKLANSAFYAWRGYNVITDGVAADGHQVPSDVSVDQATSLWFDTFIAQLEYNQWFVRIAGVEPEISISQASIRSVFDPIMANRTDISKNRVPLPLFYAPGNAVGGSWSHGAPGITSVINRDIVHLNRREVEIAGNFSAGMRSEIFDFALKGGSWKKAEENILNSWVGGWDLSWRPDLSQTINFSFLGAVNYGTVTRKGGFANQETVNDPLSDPDALVEKPLALGLGYEYRINLPGRMVMKPYAGIDFIYEAESGRYNYEIGGGLQWFFRGTGAQYKRNDKIGGVQLGDCDLPAALFLGMNVDKNGFCNAIFSFNENPNASPIPNLGGYFQFELLNISGKTFMAPNGVEYNDFLWAGLIQVEYMATSKIMPYVFFKYLPADRRGKAISDTPVYDKDIISLTSKLGFRLTPFNFFAVDVWYERNDVRISKQWEKDKGFLSINFGIRNYF